MKKLLIVGLFLLIQVSSSFSQIGPYLWGYNETGNNNSYHWHKWKWFTTIGFFIYNVDDAIIDVYMWEEQDVRFGDHIVNRGNIHGHLGMRRVDAIGTGLAMYYWKEHEKRTLRSSYFKTGKGWIYLSGNIILGDATRNMIMRSFQTGSPWPDNLADHGWILELGPINLRFSEPKEKWFRPVEALIGIVLIAVS